MKWGDKNISRLQYGGKDIVAVYWGGKKIWEKKNEKKIINHEPAFE